MKDKPTTRMMALGTLPHTQNHATLCVSEWGALAQLGERCLCKAEVTGSSPVRSIRRDHGHAFLIAATATTPAVSMR